MARLQVCLTTPFTTENIQEILTVLNEGSSGPYRLHNIGEKVEIRKDGEDEVFLGFDIPVENKGFSYAYTDKPISDLNVIAQNLLFIPIINRFNGLKNLQDLRVFLGKLWKDSFGAADWPCPTDNTNGEALATHTSVIDGYDCTVTTQTLADEAGLKRRAFSFSFTKPGRMPLKTEGYLTANNTLSSNAPFFLYFTSGGYILDCSKHEAKIMGKNANDSNARIFSIKYPLAPEYSIAEIMQSAMLTYLWVKANAALLDRNEQSPFILGGFSAGAGLAAYLAAEDPNYIDKLWLASPFIGLSIEHLAQCLADDTGLTKEALENCVQHCIGLTSRENPQFFPIYRENLTLPSTDLLAAERDLLRPFTEFLHKRLRDNQDVTYQVVVSNDPNRIAEHDHFARGYANTAIRKMIANVVKKNRLNRRGVDVPGILKVKKPAITPAKTTYKDTSDTPAPVNDENAGPKRKREL